MWFIALGVLQIVLSLAEIGPMAEWNWNFFGDLWKFVWPFIAASCWWAWAEDSGRNARKEMERLDQRREERRLKNLDILGLLRQDSKKRR